MSQGASDFTNGYHPWMNMEWMLQEFQWMSTQGILSDLSAGSFSNDNSDGSENVKKALGFISKTTALHMQHTFCAFLCYHFMATAWESPISRFMEDVIKL